MSTTTVLTFLFCGLGLAAAIAIGLMVYYAGLDESEGNDEEGPR